MFNRFIKAYFTLSSRCNLLLLAAAALLTASAVRADDDLASAPYKQASVPIEDRVKDLLGRMTVEEKARQLDFYNGSGKGAQSAPAILILDKCADDTHCAPDSKFLPDQAEKLWGTLGVGAIHDLYPYPDLANTIQDWVIKHNRLGIPALFFEEGVHGSEGFDETLFPAPIGLGATFDTDLARTIGATIAAEMRARGIHMVLGPVLDLAREPRWGRVEEDMGEDPYLTGQMGLAYVQGMQGTTAGSLASDHNIVAEPKHFAGHGSPENGLNKSSLSIGEREMRTVMLKSFEPAIVQGHAMGIMAAYHDIDGVPCTANSWLLQTVLRQEMGFQGFVLADDGAISRLQTVHHVAATPEDAICLAINSGVDMQYYDYRHDVFQNAIIQGLKDGKLKPDALDRAVSCILRVKFMLGLFDHPMTDPSLDRKVARSPEHLAASLRSSLESICLLKNQNNALPLSKKLTTVAIIGPNGNVARLGDYSSKGAYTPVSIVAGIKKLLPHATVVFDQGKDIRSALEKTKGADVIIAAMGEWGRISGEGNDRDTLDLPDNQEPLLEALVATGKKVVLVLENGRPLSIPWAAEHVPSIVEAWYPGEFGGDAVAQVLFGDYNPAGRLPVSFPRTVGALPDFYNHLSSAGTGHYVQNVDAKPVFSFGTGLSYTTFKYDSLEVKAPLAHSNDDVTVTVKVTNTGPRGGDEVAQLYVREEVADVVTPIIALKGFARIHLKTGESQTVTFTVPQSQLAVWNGAKQWAVEPGTFDIRVGNFTTMSARRMSQR
jgi:beta-glucosidase